MYAPSEEKVMIPKTVLWGIKHVYYHFSKYNIKILKGDFNAKVGRESIIKPTNGNESLHQDTNDNGVRIVNFCHIKKSGS